MQTSSSWEVRSRTLLIPSCQESGLWTLPDCNASIWIMGGDTMATRWQVHAVPCHGLSRERLLDGIECILEKVNAEMSPWRDESDLMRFNRATPGTWVTVSPWLYKLVEKSMRIVQWTQGCFDPTLGQAIDSLGYGPSPFDPDLGTCCAVASQHLSRNRSIIGLDAWGCALYQPGSVRLNLCGIAKGYAVDLVVAWLQEMGVEHFLFEIGGEVYGRGCRPDREAWWCLLESASGVDSRQSPETLLAVCGLALATSGNYIQMRRSGDLSVGHIIDPRELHIRDVNLLSVSVIDTSCMRADALATALFVMGFREGKQFADANHIRARFLLRSQDGLHEWFSDRLQDLIA
jgi:thiamine biosynthesis lipoprotein